MKRWAGALGALVVLGLGVAGPAFADPGVMQDRVDAAGSESRWRPNGLE